MQLSPSPVVRRRPATSLPFRQAFSPSARIHSARPRIDIAMMPRAQVSVANFCDWSDDSRDCVSVSNFYRKIANNPKNRLNKSNKNWCADGVHVNPGRMFVRDKADLTKGEREIIAGIYKNRGYLSNRETRNEMNQARSHRDAWLVGKQIQKKEGKLDTEGVQPLKVPEQLFSRAEPPRSPKAAPCYMCLKCKEECTMHKTEEKIKPDTRGKSPEIPGRIAPPTSPEVSPRTLRKQTRVPPIKSGEGAILIEAGKTFYDEEGGNKKRVLIDVFLPKISAQLVEEKTILSLDLPDQRLPRDDGDTNGNIMLDKFLRNDNGRVTGKTLGRLSSRGESSSGE